MKTIKKVCGLLLKSALSLAFFFVLFSFVRTNELSQILSQLNWLYLAVSFAVTLVMVAASCAKWHLIMELKNENISYFALMKIYLVGYFFSNILPSTVGGDVVRSYYAGRLIENQSFSAVSVFVERFSGMYFSFILVILSPLFQPYLYKTPYVYLASIGGFMLASATLWVWRAKNPFLLPNKLADFFFHILNSFSRKLNLAVLDRGVVSLEKMYRKIVEKLKNIRFELQVATNALKNSSGFLLRLIFWTVLFYLLTWLNVYTCFLAFNIEVSLLKICAIVPVIMLVAHVPVTLLGNLGYFESVFVFYFLLVGVGGAETLAMGLLLRVKLLVMGLLGFITYIIYRQNHKLELPESGGESLT